MTVRELIQALEKLDPDYIVELGLEIRDENTWDWIYGTCRDNITVTAKDRNCNCMNCEDKKPHDPRVLIDAER